MAVPLLWRVHVAAAHSRIVIPRLTGDPGVLLPLGEVSQGVLRLIILRRPRWAQRQNQAAEKPRQLPHILSGIELQMNLELDNLAKEGFQPEEDTIAEDPQKPSPFDAGMFLRLCSSDMCLSAGFDIKDGHLCSNVSHWHHCAHGSVPKAHIR